jgi:hypothetical protein
MTKFPLYLVRKETKVGLLGAEELAYRLIGELKNTGRKKK